MCRGADVESAGPSQACPDEEPRGEHGVGHETDDGNFEEQDAAVGIRQQSKAVVAIGADDAGEHHNSNGTWCEPAKPTHRLHKIRVARTNENNTHQKYESTEPHGNSEHVQTGVDVTEHFNASTRAIEPEDRTHS